MSDSITDSPVQEIDAVGLLCPLPILRFKKRTSEMPDGTLVDLLTDDPTGRKDLESLCDVAGHVLVSTLNEADGVVRYRVQLKSA